VPAVKPEIALTKEPVPVPSEVFVGNAIVGFVAVLQTTPLLVIALPPSFEMAPPEEAEFIVTLLIEVVVINGTLTVVIETSLE